MITDFQAIYNAYELCPQSTTLQDQHDIQAEIAKLEKQKRVLRSKIFATEDEIEQKRDKLIEALSQRLKQKTHVEELFTIHWKVI